MVRGFTLKIRNKLLDGFVNSDAENDGLESVDGVNLEVNFFDLHFFFKEGECVDVFHDVTLSERIIKGYL